MRTEAFRSAAVFLTIDNGWIHDKDKVIGDKILFVKFLFCLSWN